MSDRRFLLLVPVMVMTAAGPAAAQDGVRRIEARTAVRNALSHNSSLIAAELDVEQARQSILAEEGRYPYVFQADAGYTRSITPRLGPNDTVSTSRSRLYTVGSALRRTYPFGTTAELRVQGERFEDDFSGSTLGSGTSTGYGVSGRASLVQPLMRGFGTTVGEIELRAARLSKDVADRTRTRVTSELVRDVLIAYWELWYAGEAIEIERAALDLAEQQEKEAKEQVNQGALAPAGVLTFSTRVAQLEEAVVSAQIQKRQRGLELTRLMGTTEQGTPELIATTEPIMGDKIASRAEIEAALRAGSVELAELEAQVKLARARAEVAGESSRPRLDLEGYLETQGVSERIPRAAERAGSMGWVTAHVGLVYEMPLDDTRRRAERTSAQLAIRIAGQNLKTARDRIAAEATLAVANERAARQRLALAERTVAVAQKNFEAERARFELGEVIPIQVQQAEDELRRAKLRVARAKVDLAQSQVDVLHLSNQLVSRYRRA